MALTKITKTGITDQAVETAKIKADAVNATKIADDAISEEHLDTTIVTGFGDLGANIATTDQIIVYDQSSATLKKISQTNFLDFPTVTSVSPTSVVSGDGTGNHTFVITGTGFTGASADLINASGASVTFDSVTVNNATQITGVIAKSSLPGSGEPYDVRVTGSAGLRATLDNQINIDQQPVYVTAAGSLGTAVIGTAGSFSVNATDPESHATPVRFELQSGSLPPSYAITNTAAEGGTAIIAGTDSSTSTTTTFNFVLRAFDAASNTSSRAFSITQRAPASTSFTSSGTFAVPAGITTADVLIVAGGGGGAGGDTTRGSGGGGGGGGLVFFPSYPVTPSGTITVTVGDGGANGTSSTNLGTNSGNPGQNSVFGAPGDPGLGQGGVLTGAGGGGSSGPGGNGQPGGSGGGGLGGAGGTGGGTTQSGLPGNSGSYGFGNAGGNSISQGNGAGGGGAGAAAQNVPNLNGGAGKSYSIGDGTTSVAYAGGGGGGRHGPSGPTVGNGAAGGGDGGVNNSGGAAAQANKGGGGGGGSENPGGHNGGSGGKGIVIVRY